MISTSALSKSRILVVDDFQGMRTMLREFVRAMGVTQVDTAANGRETINHLSNSRYDIVICDFNLGPGQNGQQLLEEARLHDYIGLSTIWVMVTAEKTTDMVMGAAEVKPDDYLLKPINQSLLETRLEKLMIRKQSMRGIESAIRDKRFLEGIAQCNQLLQPGLANPQEILRIKSDLLLTVGDFDAARALFESVLATRNVPWAKTGLGRIYYLSGQYAQAVEVFRQVLSENRMFMEASDWLVKALEALGDSAQAQQILMTAVTLSPNSVARQKTLGDTAYKNGDLTLARTAFEKNIKISEFSVYKSPGAFAGLAKVLSDTNVPDEALKVLSRSKAAFKNNPEAAVQTAAVESALYKKMGQTDKAEATLADAEKLLESISGRVSPEVTLEMSQSLLALGQKEKACNLMRQLVKNNHENLAISRQIESIFDKADLGSEGLALIQESRQEVININNQGVTLAQKGEFLEGVKLLRIALQNLSGNEVILTNLCGLLMGLINKEGMTEPLVRELKELLERGRALNPANKKYQLYARALARLLSGTPPHAS